MTAAPVAYPGSQARIGDHTTVNRLLPRRQRPTVGPWCFVDVMGPDDLDGGLGMVVPPHPHTGLQTVTWLFEGEVLHRDSLGSDQIIRPGELNVMTAGRGIAHSEHSTDDGPARLQGMQLWLALPVEAEGMVPDFEHHVELPSGQIDGADVTVMMGQYAGWRSPATVHGDLTGAHLRLPRTGRLALPLEATHEHAIVGVDGDLGLDGVDVPIGSLGVLDVGRDGAVVVGAPGTRVMLLGGPPRVEPLLMWWNFVGSSAGAIEQARSAWEADDDLFGSVAGAEARLAAPPLPAGRLLPRRAVDVAAYP